MSENVKAIIKNHEVPTDNRKCRDLWRKIMITFKKEPSLTILRPDLYEDFLDCISGNNMLYVGAFYYDHDIEDMEDGYSIEIARDDSGTSFIYSKDKEGVGILYTTDEPDKYIRFGLTPVRDGYRYNFYQSYGIYVQYHHSVNDDGCAKEVRTLSGLGGYNTRYYDETGSTNLMTNAKGMWEDFKRIFQ